MTSPTRNAITLAFALSVLIASADRANAAPPSPETSIESLPLRASLSVVPLFGGHLDVSGGVLPSENEAAPAIAVAPALDVGIGRLFYVGVEPQFIANVQKKLGGPTHIQLDLAFRLGVMGQLSDQLAVFSHLLPGWSVMRLEDEDTFPHGVLIGFATGLMVNLGPALFGSGEVGYQFGRHVAKGSFGDSFFNTRYIRIGVGLGLRL